MHLKTFNYSKYTLTPYHQKQAKYLRHCAIALVSLSAAFTAQLSHSAGLAFSDNFESGLSSKWTKDDYLNMAVVVNKAHDGGAPKNGSRMLEINWNGAVAWNDPRAATPVVLRNWVYNKEFLIRMWVRTDQDFGANCGGCIARGEGAKIFRLNFVGIHGDYVTAMIQSGGSHEQWSADGLFINNWAGDKKTFLDHKWHKVEIYVYQSNTNGVVKRWQDGVLTYSYKGRTNNSKSSKYYPFYLGSNWSSNPGWQHSATNHLYVDSVEIYSDVGTGATGSMADASIGTASTPNSIAAPSNLRLGP